MLLARLQFRFSQNVVLNFADLKAGKDLTQQIQTAYGPNGHGILFVDGIPDFVQIRKKTLPLFSKIPNLPSETLKKYIRPEIYHTMGWSHGVEQFEGRYDTAKGSYYVNCSRDEPEEIKSEDLKYYTEDELKKNVGNVWINEIPQIQKNVKSLSRLMMNTGILLAQQIDAFASSKMVNYEKNQLTRIITEGRKHVGRMLHYFPYDNKGDVEDDWCGWHNDHGSLTALTSAMYVDENGNEVQLKTQSGGLYAKNRFSQMVRIAIPQNMLAFQLGEVAQIHTGGFLQATPHCVVRSDEIAGKNVGRNTFALFMGPNHLEKLKAPDGIDPEKVRDVKQYNIPQLKDRWQNGMYYKDFHWRTIKQYA